MTRSVAVCSIGHLSSAVACWKPDAIVQCASPQHAARQMADYGVPSLRLVFCDIERGSSSRRIGNGTVVKPGPHSRHLSAFLDFIRNHDGKMLLTCRAGLGRAPSLATVYLMALGYSVSAAHSRVHAAIPAASPNRRVISIGAGLIGKAADEVLPALAVMTSRRNKAGAQGAPSPLRIVIERHKGPLTTNWVLGGPGGGSRVSPERKHRLGANLKNPFAPLNSLQARHD